MSKQTVAKPKSKTASAARKVKTGKASPKAKAKTGASKSSSRSSAEQATGRAASRLLDARIRELGDWRGETLARMRALILKVDPEIVEEWKWMGTPVWSRHGFLCTGETYKSVVKLTFAHGAKLADPDKLFNASLAGNARRAIDIREGERLDEKAFLTLIRAAIEYNATARQPKPRRAASAHSASKSESPRAIKTRSVSKGAPRANSTTPVKLLSGGNPQIAKGDGDAPVQAYIAAMPAWKRDLGERLDALIERTVPQVRKAVKWNSPFYGVEGQGWFLSFHVFTRYVKVTFFQGTSLKPNPPGHTDRTKEARWIDLHEHDELNEVQLAKWLKQAAALPGWMA